MRQLSGPEAAYLQADTARANANVSLLHIFDQATAAGGVVRFKSILAHLSRRLGAAPWLRQRLQRVPLGLDHPYWVDDAHFDLEYHVRHIALPKPGDWRQFCIQVSRIHARALDLDRPPWEAYVIEGLDSFLDLAPGSFALLLKTHRAAVGLQHLSELSARLLDDDANPPPDGPAAPWFAGGAPGALALLGRGLTQGLRPNTGGLLRLARPLVAAAAQVAPASTAMARELLRTPHPLVTRFNSAVSPHRVFETRRFTEAEVAAVARTVDGATWHDVVAATCGGALRRYLADQGELPDPLSLVAAQPVWADGSAAAAADPGTPPDPTRGPHGTPPEPAWRSLVLGTHIADPLQRLAFVRDQAHPPAWPATAARPALRTRLAARAASVLGPNPAPPAHCSLTELPAPAQPLYLCGARMSYYSALLPITDGLGLAFAVTRYDGRVVISPTACRELVPDPEAFALCLRDSFQDYLALVPPAVPTAAAPRRRRAATATKCRVAAKSAGQAPGRA